jgi:uridine kinase
MRHLQKIVNSLYNELITIKRGPVLMVNISGCMGSGKTTWANALANAFRMSEAEVTHVSEDDFLQPRAVRSDLEQIRYSEGEWVGKSYWEIHENWLRLDLMRQTILNLKDGKSISYHPYKRETGRLDDTVKKIEPSDIVLFESSIFHELFDYVIMIEVDDDILLKRKVGRDADLRDIEKIKKYHEVAQLPFWKRHMPVRPDATINNNDMENPTLQFGTT